MHRLALISTTVALWSVLASGCCCVDRVYRPSGCLDGFDPVLGSCSGCGSCGGDCGGHTPGQVTRHNLTCGSGCGELYWGEWISDPPDPCDPCDGCGNFVGPRCCPPSFWRQLFCCETGFWGGRHNDCGGCAGGCSSCAGGDSEFFGDEIFEGDVIHAAPGVPQPAAPRNNTPTRAKPQPRTAPQPMPEAPATDAPATDAPADPSPAVTSQTYHRGLQRGHSGRPQLLQTAPATRAAAAMPVRRGTNIRR